MGIPASVRLRKPSEFQEVRRLGKRIHCGPFIFQCRLGGIQTPPRLGVIASRRVGNAVKRNYGKRIIRELFRKHAPNLPQCSELVIVLRNGFDHLPFAQVEAAFIKACHSIQKSGSTE